MFTGIWVLKDSEKIQVDGPYEWEGWERGSHQHWVSLVGLTHDSLVLRLECGAFVVGPYSIVRTFRPSFTYDFPGRYIWSPSSSFNEDSLQPVQQAPSLPPRPRLLRSYLTSGPICSRVWHVYVSNGP